MKRPAQAKVGELGPRGFKLVRMTTASSYDPVAGIEWTPPRESDELFGALRKAFPGRKTHRERMCEALVQFLADELEGNTKDNATCQRSEEAIQPIDQSLKASKKPLFRAQAMKDARPSAHSPPAPMRPAMAPEAGATSHVKKSGKDWEDMTVVWKSNIGMMKGARPRRMMTEEERTDYRMRRVRGACVACKRKKRKCNHDPDLSPRSSTDSIGSLPTEALTKARREEVSPSQPSSFREESKVIAKRLVRPDGSSVDKDVGSRKALEALASRNDEFLTNATQPFDTTEAATQPLDLPSSNLRAHSGSNGFPNFDGTTFGWNDYLESQYLVNQEPPNVSAETFDFFEYDFQGYQASEGIWRSIDQGFNLDMDVAEPTSSSSGMQGAATSHTNQSLPAVPQLASITPLAEEQRKAYSGSLQSAARMTSAAQLENHWAQAQGQAHVEQWLDQKVIEESSVPRDPELEVQPEEAGTEGISTNAPQRRRVKFDFSSLIDGPPTLSAPPAEIVQDQDIRSSSKQDPPRLKRSSSRHSTGSRMSFSDLTSISSAFTSMSIRDGDSRRGSLYSGGSERNLMVDDSEDENVKQEDSQMEYGQSKQDSDESSSGSGKASSEADDDAESIDWEEWLVKDSDPTLFRKELRLDTAVRQQKQS
jgi:hypothetical protein